MDMKQAEKFQTRRGMRLPYGLIGRTVLATVAVAGVVSLAVVAPGVVEAVRAWKWYDRKLHRRYQSPAYVREAVRELAKQGKVIVFKQGKKTVVRLTEKGKKEFTKYQLQKKSLKKKRWDKQWRIIIFDIAEKRRGVRDRAREDLRAFGFIKLQESVWVYPYECEEVVAMLKAEYATGNSLLYIVAGDIENDAWLKKKFSLA